MPARPKTRRRPSAPVGCGRSSITLALLGAVLAACAGVVPSASPRITAEPTPTPGAPTASPVASAIPGSLELPLDDPRTIVEGGILLASSDDGGIWAVIPEASSNVVARIQSDGRVPAGWPVRLEGVSHCRQVVPVSDGTLRILCDAPDVSEMGGALRAFAFDAGGRLLPGWPVITGDGDARTIGSDLVIAAIRYFNDVVEVGTVSHEVWIQRIAADGTVTDGERIELVQPCCLESWRLSPTGVGYRLVQAADPMAPGAASEVTAIDEDGILDGWPVVIGGITTLDPSFDANGRLFLTAWLAADDARIVVLGPAGETVGSSGLRVFPSQHRVEDIPGGAVVAGDGQAYAIEEHGGTLIDAVAGSGNGLAGWPYRSELPLSRQAPDQLRTSPVVAASNVLIVAHAPTGTGNAGSVTAIAADGRPVDGWPVTVAGPGGAIAELAVAGDGGVWVLVITPDSAELVRLGRDGSTLARVVIVMP